LGKSMIDVPSPCVRICRMDLDAGVCIGCMRTMDEISYWTRLSSAEREAVMARLPERRHEYERQVGWQAAMCERCGAHFSCGAATAEQACWCVGYPPVSPAGASCLCPRCLADTNTITY
jgi:uncharacterized protein